MHRKAFIHKGLYTNASIPMGAIAPASIRMRIYPFLYVCMEMHQDEEKRKDEDDEGKSHDLSG